MQDESRPARLQFAGFVFDSATCELRRDDGSRVPLQEQPSQVLAALLRPAWRCCHARGPARPSLEVRHVRRLRARPQHGGKETPAGARRFRRGADVCRDGTSSRVSVRCVGGACPCTGAEEIRPLPDVAVPPVAAQTPRVSRAALLVTALVTLVLLAGLAWRVQSRPRTTTQLAVMPFRVLADPGGDAAYLGIGIADAITTRLAATRQIGVRPTSAVLPFVASTADPAALAAA